MKTYRTVKDHKLFTVIPYKDKCLQLEGAVSAVAYYNHHSVDLLSGMKRPETIQDFLNVCETITLGVPSVQPRVMHLFYEMGFCQTQKPSPVSDETLLAIDVTYTTIREVSLKKSPGITLKKKRSPEFADYQRAFQEGYEELLKGNCYQFNLTYPFLYEFEEELTPQDFISALWREKSARGAFGSATYIPLFKKLFLSNSPECLFQVNGGVLSSMPIKGTLKRSDKEDWKKLWRELTRDQKSQAELYMITDLLRNDLSRIDKPCAQIVKTKAPKLVPGLLHQYSQIDVLLSEDVTLKKIFESLFPGGSVTGAPKLRAMALLERLESRERGFYCGSTVILYQQMKSASINIRSAEIDFHNDRRTLLYQAGGGITLLSKVEDEFREMTYKHNSFIDALTR